MTNGIRPSRPAGQEQIKQRRKAEPDSSFPHQQKPVPAAPAKKVAERRKLSGRTTIDAAISPGGSPQTATD